MLLSLGALPDASIAELIEHSRAVASIIPIIGFYLQPSVGGRVLPHAFWREFCQIENVVAIKVAPFNRYQTLDVIRAFAESKLFHRAIICTRFGSPARTKSMMKSRPGSPKRIGSASNVI